jgi:hypothetical protein
MGAQTEWDFLSPLSIAHSGLTEPHQGCVAAGRVVPLAVDLRVLRLSPARYRAWSKLTCICNRKTPECFESQLGEIRWTSSPDREP